MTAAPFDELFVAFQSALAGRYSLERELGRGGMGVVYLAREVRLDRPVALKLFPPELAAQARLRERFLREARTAARLSHPHIVQIYTVDEIERFVFFAMAYVDGETLGARVRRRGPMPPSEAARMLREVAWALGYAHEQGVIHRDVKPDNILLERTTGRAMVADFGIAASRNDAEQSPGEVIGTPEFMSPEQAAGERAGAQSDLYSLGIVAFYSLSGRVPFTGATSADVLAKHLTQPVPALGKYAPVVPRRIARLVDACLSKDPSERPPHAAALAEQLALAIEHRKELPVALRAFVRHDGRIDGPGVLLIPPLLAAVAVRVAILFQAAGPGFATLYLGAGLTAAGVLTARARRLLKAGFEHSDLAVAFKTDIERTKEERAFSVGARPSLIERVTKWVGVLGLGTGILELMTRGMDPRLAGAALAVGVLSGIGHLALVQRRRDVDTEFWGRLWTSRVGKMLFGIARALLPKGAIASPMTHRPTELAIAMAADQLFAELPKATKRHLGDLPAVVHRLEVDAQRMRGRLEELQDVPGAPVRSGQDQSGQIAAQLRREREMVQQKLADAVAALETIRLGLLRLRSGGGTLQSLTTDLAAAREVGQAVDRLLEGQIEVESALARPVFPSPVP